MNERPISVGELLRREGQQSESHDSQARRALGGVAVGAVLAFGAVVGGLVLHNAGATPTDMPVAGGGSAGGPGFNGSVPIASTGTIGSRSPQVQPAANTSSSTSASSAATTNPASTQHCTNVPVGGATSNSIAQTTDPQSYPSASGTLPTTTGSASTSTSTGSTSTSTGSTSTSHGSGSTTGTSSSTAGSTSTSTTTTTGSNGGGSGSGGGLLGGVGDALGSVTQPVFSWFGGN